MDEITEAFVLEDPEHPQAARLLAEIAQRQVDFCGVATLCTGRQLTKFARKANRGIFRLTLGQVIPGLT